MKVIILAAGKGTRLGKPFPKTLTKLSDGKSILSKQLDGLQNYFKSEDIFIVVGYKQNLIRKEFPYLSYISNDRYHETNTAKSLLIALKQIQNDDVLWLNGDVVFDPIILNRIIDSGSSCMAVNTSKVSDEEVKYKIGKNGRVVEISKNVLDPQGESVGIHKIYRKELKLLMKYLELCKDQDYFEKGLELAIQNGLIVFPIDISDLNCIEIDFIEDLHEANKMFEKNNLNKN